MPEWDSSTAEWYADNYGEYPTNRLAVDDLNLPSEATVVDVGCGTGAALRHAGRTVAIGSLIGVDPVPRMLEIARQRTAGHPASARIEYRLGSAENIPVEDASTHFVLAFDSIDHWRDLRKGFSEVRRILAPGGALVVVKDRAVPGADKTRHQLVDDLEPVGFQLTEQRELSGEGVHFTMWIFTRAQ